MKRSEISLLFTLAIDIGASSGRHIVGWMENGEIRTKEIAPRYFGKKVAWKLTGFSAPGKQFTLSMHWYYKLDEETVYESPEGESPEGESPEGESPEAQN